MNKINTIESVTCSGSYSLKKDLQLNAWLGVAVGLHLIALVVLKHHPEWTPLTRGLLTLTPMIPGWLYVRTCLRFIRGLDELQRRIQLEAWLFGALGALIIGTVINTLNANGVSLGSDLNHGLGLLGTFNLTFLLWAVSSVIANRRYK